ncbi:DUF1120 domain-containing protein [Serratia fonticola]
MKKLIGHMSAATVICISINSAIAAGSSLNLKVKGEITAPSCIINLNDNGVVDLGKIATNSIQANTPTKLNDPRPITIQATCDADTALTFSIVDNRVATASTPSTKHFGLGSVNGTGKLGYYGIKMKMGYVDSKEVNLFAVAKSSASFGTSKEVDVDTSKIMGWSESDNKLAIGKNFISVLQVMPYLASAKDMGGSVPEDTKLDGSATLSFAFGI